jgi:hypothetical protein
MKEIALHIYFRNQRDSGGKIHPGYDLTSTLKRMIRNNLEELGLEQHIIDSNTRNI